jgi:hypothetical protein
MKVINKLKKDYILKCVGEPMFYLGGDVKQLGEAWQLEEIDCALSANTYIHNAVKKVKTMVDQTLYQHKSPMEEAFHPELDDLPMLSAIKATQYQTLIGMANWMIVLGPFDIHYVMMVLSGHNVVPREGHFKTML